MTNVVINLADAVQRQDRSEEDGAGSIVTPAETLELVRAYALIKDPARRQAALDQLKRTAVSQV